MTIEKQTTNNCGFTLIELIVVIAIIGILAGLIIVRLSDYPARARNTRRIADLNNINQTFQRFKADGGTLQCMDTTKCLWGGDTCMVAPVPGSTNVQFYLSANYYVSADFICKQIIIQGTANSYPVGYFPGDDFPRDPFASDPHGNSFRYWMQIYSNNAGANSYKYRLWAQNAELGQTIEVQDTWRN
ncbi:hypothetical protein AUK11_01650 [bacterium CG2_30_37_16]|nr:MAG: hypothetical protein AUK11_01650 [bacterium CG2_30_37_16]PIP30350.1 MAG: hypothetical protein COX25_05080 [bacterium (Candidatus Howlettbacteria) CG23_combo_of_CG06-09_8_20_14_all_37_9]PJB05749.1 MAG: hypothetical protein CO123_03410 [bacterium (Candidatus Howlettbacteria) CG_4_9_14_3_um_filter_37_10]